MSDQIRNGFYPRLQFRLRTFLIVSALVSALLGLAVRIYLPWYQDQRIIAALRATHAQVFTEPRGQFLLRQFIGDSLSERSVYLHLNDSRVDDQWLKSLPSMQHIEVLSVRSPNVTDAGLMELRKFPSLLSLNLTDTKVTASGIAALRRSLPGLRLVDSRPSKLQTK